MRVTGELLADEQVRVCVADRGIGISAGEHDRVFAAYHRAHRDMPHPGTGLGLAICHQVVLRHGGTISAVDNPGGGTVLVHAAGGLLSLLPAPGQSCGSRSTTRVPRPRVEISSSSPPCARITPFATVRPSPVPCVWLSWS